MDLFLRAGSRMVNSDDIYLMTALSAPQVTTTISGRPAVLRNITDIKLDVGGILSFMIITEPFV